MYVHVYDLFWLTSHSFERERHYCHETNVKSMINCLFYLGVKKQVYNPLSQTIGDSLRVFQYMRCNHAYRCSLEWPFTSFCNNIYMKQYLVSYDRIYVLQWRYSHAFYIRFKRWYLCNNKLMSYQPGPCLGVRTPLYGWYSVDKAFRYLTKMDIYCNVWICKLIIWKRVK